MALFGGGESKEDKQEKKVREILEKYGMTDLSDPRDVASVREIATLMAGNKLMSLGSLLSSSGVDSAKLDYLNILMEQNFIIIRQLERLNNK